MEGPADLQGQAALGAQLLGQCGGLVHGGLLATDDQLAGAVVVGDLHHAGASGLPARLLELLAVQAQHGGHAAGTARRGCGHGLAAKGGQGNGLGSGEHPGALEGGVLAQGEARGVVRDNAPLRQQGGHAGGKGHHTGLGVLGQVQHPVGVGEHGGFQIEVHAGGVQHGAEGGMGLVEIGPHAGVLAALPGV